jgi:peptidyl-prolyl cis-trans isomerase D
MSVLSSIRSRAGLLVAVIGIALLAFILGDIFTSGRSIFSSRETNVAVVGGEDISYLEFEHKVQEVLGQQLNQMKRSNPNATLDENTTDELVKDTWTRTINEKLFNHEFDKIGVTVSGDELLDSWLGKDPHPEVIRYFSDQRTHQILPEYARPDGKLNPIAVKRYLDKVKDEEEKQVVEIEKYIRTTRKQTKYMNLIKKGLYVTTAQGRHDSTDASAFYTLRYIGKKYSSATDSALKVTDSDLLTWYNAHQYKYNVKEAVRNIEYINFDITPSRRDINDLKGDMLAMVNEFKTKTGKEDSAFVQGESDSRVYKTRLIHRGSLKPDVDSVICKGVAGTVAGPVEEGNKMILYKLVATEHSSDSAKVRHILIAYKGAARADSTVTRTKDQAKHRADSLLALVKSKKKKLEDLVFANTDDGGSKSPTTKEGEMGYHGIYGWYTADMGFATGFKNYGLQHKKGEMAVVETEFGYHIMEVIDKTKESDKFEIVTIERQVQASKATVDSVFTAANKFAGINTTSDLFEKAVVKDGLNKRMATDIKASDHTISGLESPRELIHWIYADERKKGDVSQPFQLGERFVIATVTSVREKGVAPLDEVKDKVEMEVKKEKKAENFIALFTKESAGVSKIEDLASKMREPAQRAENLNFSSTFIPGVGQEYNLIGYMVTSKEGVLSKPIKGNSGVYVIMIEKIARNDKTETAKAFKKLTLNNMQAQVDQNVYDALKESANIKDNRAKFF